MEKHSQRERRLKATGAGEWQDMQGLSKNEKGLMDMDNSGDCWKEWGIREPKGNVKKIQ